MSKFARRVDDNQGEIVLALRAAGATVRIITQGDGIPDLLVGYNKHTVLMEVKDGKKVPSAQKLTVAEEKFHREWPGDNLHIVTSVDAALALLKSCV